MNAQSWRQRMHDRLTVWRHTVRDRLADGAPVVHKLWSTWAIAASMALNEAVQYWPVFPDDLKQYLPHVMVKWMARASFPAIIILRVIKQKSLSKDS